MPRHIWLISLLSFLMTNFTLKTAAVGESVNSVHTRRQSQLGLEDTAGNTPNLTEVQEDSSRIGEPFLLLIDEHIIDEHIELLPSEIDDSLLETSEPPNIPIPDDVYFALFRNRYVTEPQWINDDNDDCTNTRSSCLDVFNDGFFSISIQSLPSLKIEMGQHDGLTWDIFEMTSDKAYLFRCDIYQEIRVWTQAQNNELVSATYDLECQNRYLVYWNRGMQLQ